MCGLSPLASFYFIIIIIINIIIIIIIVVVVVVDDDTYYWVYLSSDHLFQVYYKVRQVLLQSATGITKCDNFTTKCDDYYKVRQYREFKIPRRRRPRKRRLNSEFAFFQSLLWLLELFLSRIPKNHIQLQKEKENLADACLRPP